MNAHTRPHRFGQNIVRIVPTHSYATKQLREQRSVGPMALWSAALWALAFLLFGAGAYLSPLAS